MSGPKGGSYVYVESAAARRQRECAQSSAAVTAAERRFEEVCAGLADEARAYLNAVPNLRAPARPQADDLEGLRACAEELADLTAAAHLVWQEIGAVRAAKLLAAAGASGSADVVHASDLAPAPHLQGRAERVQEVLAGLPGDVTPEERRQLEALGAKVLAQGRRADEVELRRQAQMAREQAARRRRARSDLLALTAALGPYADDGAVGRLRGLIEEVQRDARQEEVDGLLAQGEALLTRYREQEDRVAATEVAAEAFRALGYSVEEGFATGGPDEIVLLARRPSALDDAYAVQFRLREGQARFNVVRETAAGTEPRDPAAERAAEESWCADLPAVLATMDEGGLRVHIESRVEAGALPVQQVSGRGGNARQRARRRQARELGR